jgi:AFG3 family protein
VNLGFENFFPKGSMPPKKSDQKKDEDKRANGQDSSAEKKTEKRDEASSSSEKEEGRKQRQGFGGSGGGDQNNNQGSQQPEQIGGLLALLLIVLGVRSFQESEERSGSEITFSDFRQLLTLQQVERMVVVNKKMARVHLKPGAIGLTHVASESAFTEPETTSTAGDADWNDGTQMEWGGRAASVASSGASTSGRVASSQGKTLTYHFYFGSVESLEEKLTKTQQELGIAPRDYLPLQYVSETNWVVEVIKASPAIAMVGLTLWLFRGGGASAAGRNGGIFQIGKSNAKKINKEDINVTFKDVAGCDEAKKEIMEFVDFLQDSSRFTKLGAKIPKGALLYGPPGTGKTLLAKAVAGEASVPFFSVSGSDFLEMFVGVGPSRVRDLFKEARANAPCIVFIDEIDAVGRQRGRGGFSGGNDERENTLNQLLVEMDGFSPTTGVVVLAGTNRVDILDQALTRPGRFDRQIVVDKPDLQGRREIFRVHLKGITLEDDMDDIAGRLAGLTPGFAGADIANICNEAAIVAARRQADAVSMVDFEKAIDRVIGGLESNKIMSEEEKSIVAYHEAGHAIAGWFLEHADPLLKVTIIPRTSGALGFAQYLPKEIFLRSQDQIMDIVCMALAGRASEQVFFGRVTTGASDDLRRVTDIVYSMIHTYGMNSRVGQLAFPRNDNGMPGDKPYSDATAEAMDEEARSIVDAAYQRTVDLIMQHKAGVEKVALKLLDQETITHDDIVELVGPRPFEGDDMYKEYVSHKSAVNKRKEQTNKEEAQDEKHDGVPDEGLTPELA